ncbi:MAG: hypothetical protein C1O27_002124 [Chloroflexi bacterium]|jgi:hypothetical protein|nr:MAG: hypothetical protein C1O27_002124 [Chloroflexota bacterium]
MERKHDWEKLGKAYIDNLVEEADYERYAQYELGLASLVAPIGVGQKELLLPHPGFQRLRLWPLRFQKKASPCINGQLRVRGDPIPGSGRVRIAGSGLQMTAPLTEGLKSYY